MKRTLLQITLLNVLLCSTVWAAADWQPATSPLTTRWAKDVSPAHTLPEYPRPQMERKEWLNLNGLWDYAIVSTADKQPDQFQGQILVPFAAESALSGVMKPVTEANRLWYRRQFEIPSTWKKQRVLLHFGAVDWETAVWVNGKQIGTHRGGYDGFCFDITDALKKSGQQEIVVSVWDPTSKGPQARGKQNLKPEGIWYTPISGIWQTVWLEPVAKVSIEHVRQIPDIDANTLSLTVDLRGDAKKTTIEAAAFDGEKEIAKNTGQAGQEFKLNIPNPKLWSPDSPALYGLKITVRQGSKVVDEVTGYFGMRKISIGKAPDGNIRMFLNNQPLFQFGPLDQGFWPDGLYTAPTDEALRYDIEVTRQLGYNFARKHVKVEPARWYYWCDKLGLMVWQDMPSSSIGDHRTDLITPGNEDAARQFETELTAVIKERFNHPSIIMWVPFNEGWGQHYTPHYADLVKRLDPSRLVDSVSGWTDRRVGDVFDIHNYPNPAVPRLDGKRAGVLGEFGGLGLPVNGHLWQGNRNWGYLTYNSMDELTTAYVEMMGHLRSRTGADGLAAAVYTQTTDVEGEVNGLMTYDRAMLKMDAVAVAAANKTVYTPPLPRISEGTKLVPPATPLVACDPYFSVWSQADNLTDVETTHWTGKKHRLVSLVRIDGQTYRVMGMSPAGLPALTQKSLEVLPTRTLYTFEGANVALTLTFLTPALPDDLDVLSRPVTYLTYEFRSTDGKSHDVSVYFDASAELAVNNPDQEVVGAVENINDLETLKIGSTGQSVLGAKGDDIRIDWGYLYVSAPKGAVSAKAIGSRSDLERGFAGHKLSSVASGTEPVTAGVTALGMELAVGKVSSEPVSTWLMVAYDDLYSIQYMRKNLRPYWRRNGWEAADLLQASAKEYDALKKRCEAFDAELMADLTKAGGEKYAKLCALAYRQCLAAGKIVADANGQPLQFCKENHSNGCIGTADVFYPMAPQFLLFGPSLAKSFLVPFMNYAASERWKFPFAPHDLGQYPMANGQVYGGGERNERDQMPVEESGNLLLLITAIAQMEGNPGFAELYWPQLEKWADYLKAKGFDPENQLCTDDFAGHLAHNVNLSAKAICGLGAFGKLCEMRGDKAKADEYLTLAREFAQRWVKEAKDGDHFRLAFDRPGTWSQKYNLVWDRILGLNLFPAEVAQTEMAYYKKMQNKYGLPLDNRERYTKLDWILWTATLTQNPADFEALVDPVFRFLNETGDRSPMTDWYFTDSGGKRGFTARPVVGGVFLQTLYDKALWDKWAGREKIKATNWAAIPPLPKITTVVPAADKEPAVWRYTINRPVENWAQPSFDDSGWSQGKSGFGQTENRSAVVNTTWEADDIWLRREVELPADKLDSLELWIHHDDDVWVYINGVEAAHIPGPSPEYFDRALKPAAKAALKPGKNLIAVHCRDTGGEQYIDVGLRCVEAQ